MTSSLAPWFRASLGSCTVAVLLSLAQVSAPRAVAQPTLRPRVVLISLDGFRADYLDRPGAVHLRALASRGVRAERLVPSFPSKTFPNHYTLVTGLYPEHHGITANVMQDAVLGRFATGSDPSGRDARWWLGEPIWVTAERQQMRTAVLFWPGNEAPIGGVRPHWWQTYDGSVTHAQRVRQVLSWLAMPDDSAPRFVAVYFSEVDSKGHDFGPRAPQTDSAIARVDSAVGAIATGITALDLDDRVNLIVVSDHGMTEISRDRLIALDDLVSPDSMTVIDMEPVSAIVPKPGADDYVYRALHGAHPHLRVWRKRDVPARFHFNSGTRIAPIIALADEGWTVVPSRDATTMAPGQIRGAHGYDNRLPSMGALFVAAGPAFKRGVRVAPFENVQVYPLLAHVLGLTAAHTDGSLARVRSMLRDPSPRSRTRRTPRG